MKKSNKTTQRKLSNNNLKIPGVFNTIWQKSRFFWKKMKLWQRAVFTVIAIAVLIVLFALITNFFQPTNKTIVTPHSNNPEPVSFHDSKVINFVTNDENDYTGTTIQTSLPEPNNERELSNVQSLYVYYNVKSGSYAPVFKMDATNQDLEKYITINPFIKGKWSLNGSDGVVFSPTRDWPADKKFTIHFNKKMFNSDVRPESYKTSFTTEKLISKIESFDAYPELSKQKSMVAVGVISFNYPVDVKSFEDNVSVKLDGKKIGHAVKFDTFNRTAFVTSDIITVKDKPQKLKMEIGRIDTTQGNAKSAATDGTLVIESEDNFFKISDVSTHIVDNQKGEPEQLLLLNLTSSARSVDWNDYIKIYLLPRHKDKDKTGSYSWKTDEISETVLAESDRLDLKQIDFANPSGVYQYAFAYDVSENYTRYIYVDIKPGFVSDMGFPLKNRSNKIMRVPYPTKEVKIAGTGAILSMAGGKELAIMARGGADAAYVNLHKIKSTEINHLISQTYNVLNSVDFKGYSFGTEDMSVVFNKKITFADSSFKKTNYSSVNLGDYINRSSDKTGIFVVQVGASQDSANYNDKRLILLTDLGIIRKINADDTSVIFVSSLAGGNPVSGARVQVLGRNGNAVWSGETDWSGRANVPKFAHSEYKNEKEPVAFVVTYGTDVSFIPYNAYSQQVEFSKFDIDGTYSQESNAMNAYLFSDRGIYRPGEQFVVGGIVKSKDFKSLSGIPVKIEIKDSRSKIILEKTFSLTSDGMFDIEHKLSGAAPIGNYQIHLYSLTDKNKTKYTLGTGSLRVEEFVPDTLKIKASIIDAKTNGWIKTSDAKANVTLRNLFGTPATDRRISSRATLTPTQFSFPEFKDYTFTPNYIAGSGLSNKSLVMPETLHQNLADTNTDETGVANIDIKFDSNINPGTYVLSFTADGFEGDSGKSVTTATATKVSDADYLLGYKPSSDLAYVNKGAKRSVHLVAINSDVQKITVDKLSYRIVKKQNLVSLVKDYSGYYKYQTVSREKIIKTGNISVPKDGTTLNLDTSSSGDYYVQISDDTGRILVHRDYFIAGNENLALATDQQAELKIKLNKQEYAAGSEIQINISSPYTGTGLITIEKDKVYTHKWFKTSTTSSIQTITLPDNFEGSGYVNVSFVRDINSKDVFTTPYTYAVAPFAVDKSRRTINIDLKTQDIVRDKKLTVRYTTDKSSRLMIFAVNEGILQVAKYQTPKPLNYFLKKSALQVSTFQILSLLLPEYKILREFAKTGGGDYEELAAEAMLKQNITNPFARIVDAPVAFYSGIVDTVAATTGSITFDIPDHFNGGVRVYAIAANNNAMGAAETESKIQSPVIISETLPLMAVPNDEFTANVVISNMTEQSGKDAQVKVSVSTSDNLEIIGDKEAVLNIAEGSEKLWNFNLKAKNKLGNATVNITASVLDKNGNVLSSNTSKSTLSVRPTALFTTNLISGYKTDKKISIKDFQIDMYSEFMDKTLYVSDHSFVLIKPLFEYLKKYEYSCSEQTVSKTLPYVLFPESEFLGTKYQESTSKIADAITVLSRRQNDNGSFSLWAGYGNNTYDFERNEIDVSEAFVTAYVVQFLTLAKENGFNVPTTILSKGVDYLRTYAGKNIQNKYDADTKAFAIYLVTRNGYVTTAYIDAFQEYVDKNLKDWEKSLSGAYIASAYKLLKQDDKAASIIRQYELSGSKKFTYFYDFSNNVTNDANYAYLLNAHFKSDITQSNIIKVIDPIIEYIQEGHHSSFTSSAAILALSGFKNDGKNINDNISVTGTKDKNTVNLHPTDTGSKNIFKTNIPTDVTRIEIACADCNQTNGVFYTIVQQGFAKKTNATERGIEIIREYYNAAGQRITSAMVGDDVTVKISIRATDGSEYIDNVVISDLLPSGFMAVQDSISGSYDFQEMREDRVVIYRSVSKRVSTIEYKAKITTAGTFTIPGIWASSMYNPKIMGVGKTDTFKVESVNVK